MTSRPGQRNSKKRKSLWLVKKVKSLPSRRKQKWQKEEKAARSLWSKAD